MPPGEQEVLLKRLLEFVREDLLGDDEDGVSGELKTDSPLLEWGVLNSMNTARLLTFVREEFHVAVPPMYITGRHFKNLDSIADLVMSLPAS